MKNVKKALPWRDHHFEITVNFWLVLAAFVWVSTISLTASAQETKPNILLVVVDDAGFMDFGAYGSDTATPNIDRLAKSGAVPTKTPCTLPV